MSNPSQTLRDTTRTCRCADPDLDRLRALMADGHTQVEASRIIWAPDTLPTRPEHAPAYVRGRLTAAFPWLRLPRKVAPPS